MSKRAWNTHATKWCQKIINPINIHEFQLSFNTHITLLNILVVFFYSVEMLRDPKLISNYGNNNNTNNKNKSSKSNVSHVVQSSLCPGSGLMSCRILTPALVCGSVRSLCLLLMKWVVFCVQQQFAHTIHHLSGLFVEKAAEADNYSKQNATPTTHNYATDSNYCVSY